MTTNPILNADSIRAGALQGPKPADIQKQMNEINQWALCRVLTALGTTAFIGAGLGLLLPPQLSTEHPVLGKVYLGSTILMLGIGGAASLNRKLSNLIRVYAAWLNYFDASGWEHDIQLYGKHRSATGIMRPFGFFYVIALLFCAIIPLMYEFLSIRAVQGSGQVPLFKDAFWVWAGGLVLSVGIVLWGALGQIDDDEARAKWELCDRERIGRLTNEKAEPNGH